MERSVAEFLNLAGVDLSDPHLVDTPRRVASMFNQELLAGYDTDVASLFRAFEDSSEQFVLVQDIPFHSLCAHHLLPFFGTAAIAYQPDGRIVGLSKLARVVDCYARRLQVQERLTNQVADAIEHHITPLGVAVVLRAEHLCMSMRGARCPGARTTSCAVRGSLAGEACDAGSVLRPLLTGG